MTKTHAMLAAPLFAAVIATAFCVWSALGNDVNFCVTTGCTLYQDFSVGGVSLWWFGTGAFTLLAACALLGQREAGYRLSGFFVVGDVFLLLLMALTAPCVSCLVAAFFFALCYWFFRRSVFASAKPGQPTPLRRSILLAVWLTLFVVNLGAVARSQFDVWPLLDESGDAHLRMFFSPACTYCAEGINVLSGNVNVAFYPVAENEADVLRIAKMQELLDKGEGIAEALGQSMEEPQPGGIGAWSPEMLLLRFRLLRNKAHIFASGSQSVPFFETLGLPGDIAAKSRERAIARRAPVQNAPANASPKDHALPVELEGLTQCGGQVPCPPQP